MDRSQLSPEDTQLISRFDRARCSPETWSHELFLRLAWAFYRLGGQTFASVSLRTGLARLGEAHGDHIRFDHHETRTRFWLTMIAAADTSDQMPSASSREFIWRHPELLDADLVLRFYTRRELSTDEARTRFLPPRSWHV